MQILLKSIGGMETRLQTKPKSSHLILTLYWSYKDNTFLLTWSEAETNVPCMPDLSNILIECTDLAHIRENFYSANDMKERLKNIEIKCYVIPKSDKYIRKNQRNFNKTKFLLPTDPLQDILQQNLILSTNCSKKIFLIHDNSLQKNFQQNLILSTNRFPINKV